MGVSMGKSLQSPTLILGKPKKDISNVSSRCDMTEMILKVIYNNIQSICQSSQATGGFPTYQ